MSLLHSPNSWYKGKNLEGSLSIVDCDLLDNPLYQETTCSLMYWGGGPAWSTIPRSGRGGRRFKSGPPHHPKILFLNVRFSGSINLLLTLQKILNIYKIGKKNLTNCEYEET